MVRLYGRTARRDLARLAATIKKGDTVLCIGKIETSEYQGKTYKTLVCEYICVMGAAPAQAQAAPAQNNTVPDGYEELLTDDDMPF